MIAQLKRDDFVAGLQRVLSALSQKATLPILSYVRMTFSDHRLSFETTDLDVFIRWGVPCDQLEGEMDVCIPVKRLFGILKDIAVKDVTVEGLEQAGIRVTTGSGDFRFYGMQATEFPSFPSFEEDLSISLPSAKLRQLLDKTLYCVGSSETREVLNGLQVMLEEGLLRSVATDGRRLATDAVEGSFSGGKSMIVPRKAMLAVRSCLEGGDQEGEGEAVEMVFGVNHGAVRMKNGMVFARLLEGSFPDYREVIPSSPIMELKVDRESLISASRRVGLFSTGEAAMIKAHVCEDRLLLSASSTDVGEGSEVVGIKEGKGTELEFGINYRYLIDALGSLKDEEVFLDLMGSRRPVCIRGHDAYRAVVMPMRLEGVA